MREDYVVSKAVRGMDEVFKSSMGGARSAARRLAKNPAAARQAQITDDPGCSRGRCALPACRGQRGHPERQSLNQVMASEKPH